MTPRRAASGKGPRWVNPACVAVGVLVAAAVILATGGASLIADLVHLTGCGFPLTRAPAANYDEQLFLAQGGSSGSLAVIVQAVAQTDANGYGPAYLVNGLTSEGYWYQVGIAYDWGCGSGYVPGFHYFSEVWNTSGESVFGPNFLPLPVADGDRVNLSLALNGSSVAMLVTDLTDGETQSSNYPAESATNFEGGLAVDGQEPGWFTGVMTEWFHAQPYYGGEQAVTYTATTPFAGEATRGVSMGIDELNASGGQLFGQTDFVEVTCGCSYPFSYQNATEAVGTSWFQTGG